MAWSKSVCSVLVGRPVLGPPRCTSITTNGNSAITASPIASLLRLSPGPDVEVHAKSPAKAAPIEIHAPEISSSACTTITPMSLRPANSCMMSVAGVIG